MKKIIYVLFVLLLAACSSSPMDKEYNETTQDEDLKTIRASNQLDSATIILLESYFAKAKGKGENLKGKTYAEILVIAKAGDKENNTETEDENSENFEVDGDVNTSLAEGTGDAYSEKVAELRKVLDVNFVDKGFFKGEEDDFISYEFILRNKADKSISSFVGDVVINDLNGTKIKVITLEYNNPIGAKSEVKFGSTSEFDANDENDNILKAKTVNDVQMVWNPRSITYSDGTPVE